MAAGISVRAAWDNLRSLAFGSISGTYAALGVPLANPARVVKIINTTDAAITMSTDGINDKDIIPSNSFVLYDFTTNKDNDSSIFVVPKGIQFYVKGSPSSGSVYISVIFAIAT